MRYFIELSYKGTNYAGWQRQKNAMSVQQKIEDSLVTLLRRDIQMTGCGRTDTGVHATHYIAHIDYDGESIATDNFVYHLNCILPRDIAIHSIYECDLHARFDAVSRGYQYRIALCKDPFETESAWLITTPLDVKKMQQTADVLKTHNDFTSMCKTGSENKTNNCKIFEINWQESENLLIFTVKADRFLRGMVRALVGTMVEVGRNKLSVEDVNQIMLAQNRSSASASAPPQGLFMTGVEY